LSRLLGLKIFLLESFIEEQVNMALEDKIEAVKKIGKALSNTPITELEVERVPPNKEHFDSLMSPEQSKDAVQKQKLQESTTVEAIRETANRETTHRVPSFFDQVKKLDNKVKNMIELSPEDLKKQIRDVISKMDELKTDLADTKELKPSYQTIMHNRLTHVDDSIKIALSKAGVEYKDVTPTSPLHDTQLSPLDRFLGYLTHGQYQLEHLNTSIEEISKHGQTLSQVQVFQIQMKMGQIQLELELFANSLNKMLESAKTIMNVQV